MSNKLKLIIISLLSATGCLGAGFVDYRSLLTTDFSTNFPSPFFVGVKTNKFPAFSQFDTNSFLSNGLSLSINTNGTGLSNIIFQVSSTNDFWKTNQAAASSISNKYPGEVLINSKLLIDQGGGDKLGFGEGLSSPYPDVSAFAGIGARYSWPSTMGLFFHNHEGYLLTLGWNNYDAGREPIGRTYSNMSKTEDGYSFSWYNDLNGGSASGMKDLPGNDINSNQRNPAFIIASGVNGVTSEATMRVAISNFFAYGYGTLTNYDFIRAFGIENYFLTNHRDANGVLAWNTNSWPMQTVSRTNLFYYLGTNYFEGWLTLYGDTRPVQTNNTEFDVDAFTGATFWMYPNGPNGIPGGGLMQPMVTPSSKHLDITTFYQWGVGGVTFQDTTTAFAGTPGSAQQLMRGYGGSATWPGSLAYPGVSASSDWFHYYTNRTHGLILNYLWFYPPFPVSFQREANGVALESGVVVNEPGSSGVLRLAIGALRSSIHSLTNWEAGTIHWIPQTDNLLYDGSWNYADCKDLLSVMAITGGDEWIRSASGGVLTNTSFRLTVTNAGQISVWQDQLRGANSGFKVINFGPTNQICYRPLIGGDVAVFFSNEDPSAATNLTVNWGQLNFASNYPAVVTEVWTNALLGSYTNSFTVSVPAASSTVIRFSPANGGGLSNYVSSVSSTANNFWVTNVPEGGIMYSNPATKEVAKFSAGAVGTFVAGQTNATAIMLADAVGSFALGSASGASSLIYADGEGSLAGGQAQAAGTIKTSELGAMAWGHANASGSTILASQPGTFAFGDAITGGTITSSLQGAIAAGRASNGGSILSSGFGSFGFGQAVLNGSANITANASGTLAFGVANGGVIIAHDIGTMAYGDAENGGLIESYGPGSMARGYIGGTNGMIITYGNGTTAWGQAESNSVIKVGDLVAGQNVQKGGSASGYANGIGTIWAHGNGAFVHGVSSNVFGWLTATGQCAVTFGESIRNEAAGGFSFAYGKLFTNNTANSFNVGWNVQPSLQVATNQIALSTDNGTGNVVNRQIVQGGVKTFTTNSATTVVSITLPTSLTCFGAKLSATTEIKSGSDLTSCREDISISAKNLSGTVTATNSQASLISTIPGTTATVVNSWSTSVSSTTVSVQLTSVTSAIQATTSRLIGLRLELDSDSVCVVTWP